MEIYFGTKEENNARRQEEFLKLHPAERVMAFIRLSQAMAAFPTHAPKQDKGNFVLTKKKS
ncbi:hypothetical protein AM493_08990 [Flavobacterium akiainvivens]|uniref:Uncharacterized protein n=1 Tax=Flavobacterium akiainvivens TaxID=1202724 RepID=A0A0M8M982_9FLAO|nr:hypothetical protein [Flavobacterium akiainvivens]KOS06153.1 hypothetical protein AM493_08990 [Flavobacterium akiainvivens]SFQ67976.1 hypothetical protein SAMN05444144_11432 [Flavobacterium akiainvivens]